MISIIRSFRVAIQVLSTLPPFTHTDTHQQFIHISLFSIDLPVSFKYAKRIPSQVKSSTAACRNAVRLAMGKGFRDVGGSTKGEGDTLGYVSSGYQVGELGGYALACSVIGSIINTAIDFLPLSS